VRHIQLAALLLITSGQEYQADNTYTKNNPTDIVSPGICNNNEETWNEKRMIVPTRRTVVSTNRIAPAPFFYGDSNGACARRRMQEEENVPKRLCYSGLFLKPNYKGASSLGGLC
jgi:hypothetical protein